MKKIDNLLNVVDSDILMEMVQEVNAWDSSLDYLEYIETDQFDEYFFDESPANIANMIYYGDFNPACVYFKVNGYGNIESYNTYEVLEDLENCKEEIVERFVELYEQGNINSTYQEVLAILEDK